MFKGLKKDQAWEDLLFSFFEVYDSISDLKKSSSTEEYGLNRIKFTKVRDKCQKCFDKYLHYLNEDSKD